MPELKTIQLILTGPFKDKTKLFGKYQFVKGICNFTGNDIQIANVTKYFVTSYQVKVKNAVVDEEAMRVDDPDVVSNGQQNDPEGPNVRQAAIIAAINEIEKTKWVDKNARTPRPRVKDVSTLMDDPTVIAAEIVEVIEKWLS